MFAYARQIDMGLCDLWLDAKDHCAACMLCTDTTSVTKFQVRVIDGRHLISRAPLQLDRLSGPAAADQYTESLISSTTFLRKSKITCRPGANDGGK